MKKLFYFILISFAFLSCKKSNTEPVNETPANITGTLYGVPFTSKVALERNSNFSMSKYKAEDLFSIYLSSDGAKNCGSANDAFDVRLTVPRKVGKFSQGDVYILTNDPKDPTRVNGGLFSSETTTITILSITSTQIIGEVDIKRPEDNIDFKGRFEASYCK